MISVQFDQYSCQGLLVCLVLLDQEQLSGQGKDSLVHVLQVIGIERSKLIRFSRMKYCIFKKPKYLEYVMDDNFIYAFHR